MTYTGQGEFGSKVQCLHLVWHNLVLLVLRLYLNSVLNYEQIYENLHTVDIHAFADFVFISNVDIVSW